MPVSESASHILWILFQLLLFRIITMNAKGSKKEFLVEIIIKKFGEREGTVGGENMTLGGISEEESVNNNFLLTRFSAESLQSFRLLHWLLKKTAKTFVICITEVFAKIFVAGDE